MSPFWSPALLLYLCALPLWLGALLIVALPTALAMLGPSLVRKRVSLSELAQNNEIAGFKFATVGVIYAVILAFAVIAVWDKFSEAELHVLREAGASATLYRIAGAGEDANAATTRSALDAYLTSVVEDDWIRMAQGEESRETNRALTALYDAAIRLAGERSPGVAGEVMKELGAITQARRGRLHLARGVVPTALWTMLLTGAAITIGFTYFFGMKNLRAQAAMIGGLSAIVFLGLFVIVSYDHPFTGDVAVEAHPLKQVLQDFRRG